MALIIVSKNWELSKIIQDNYFKHIIFASWALYKLRPEEYVVCRDISSWAVLNHHSHFLDRVNTL